MEVRWEVRETVWKRNVWAKDLNTENAAVLRSFFRVLKVQLGNFNPNIAFSLGSVNYEID